MINFADYFNKAFGIDLTQYDESFLIMSLNKRLQANGLASLSDYRLHLQKTILEADLLLNSLNISYTTFFRNPLTCAYLEQVVFPMLMEKRKNTNNKEVRIWSAACASGQEAYSMAIICDEVAPGKEQDLSCHIFATDVDPQQIAAAEKGVYHVHDLENVSLRRVNRFFERSENLYAVSPSIKSKVHFDVFDLLNDRAVSPEISIYGEFDIILCCNVLFYYTPEMQQLILDKMELNLAPGGFLITGETEREILKAYHYQEVFVNSAIFKKMRSDR
ncbi:MAG: CheR family methyltransferase [Microbacter sp.]